MLGRIWYVLSPLLFMGVYTFTYAIVLRLRPGELTFPEYMMHLFAGILPFLAISEALTNSVSCIRTNQNLLTNASFPIESLPFKAVLVPIFTMLWGLGILVPINIYLFGFQPKMLLLGLVLPLHFLFLAGISFFLSIMGTLLKDMQQLIAYISMIIMLASPIAYTESMIPESLRLYIYLNPFSFLIQSYQSCFVPGYFAERSLIIFGVLSLVCFYSGFFLFMKVKKAITIYG